MIYSNIWTYCHFWLFLQACYFELLKHLSDLVRKKWWKFRWHCHWNVEWICRQTKFHSRGAVRQRGCSTVVACVLSPNTDDWQACCISDRTVTLASQPRFATRRWSNTQPICHRFKLLAKLGSDTAASVSLWYFAILKNTEGDPDIFLHISPHTNFHEIPLKK